MLQKNIKEEIARTLRQTNTPCPKPIRTCKQLRERLVWVDKWMTKQSAEQRSLAYFYENNE